jgi:phosphatidylglycerol:prolipoprotein diacylglycerol transferase
MYPILLELGPLTIYSYGAMMALAFLTAAYLTSKELDRKGYNGEAASSMVVWAAIGGLVGARLWAVFNDWSSFLAHPVSFLFSGAGFVFYGGLIGGFVAVSWSMRRYHLPWTPTVDAIAPGLALAHAIGRIGCELAGDGDWGTPSTLPWAHSYPNAIIGWEEWTRAAGYPPDVRVHPAPVYETLAYTAVFAVLWAVRKRPLAPGSVFWLYLVLAPAARFLIEFVRINPPVLWGMSQAQLTSLALIAIGTWKLVTASPPAAAHTGVARAARAAR